jgi:hypothetical protein
LVVTIHQLAPDEQLSPELVLVLTPELRAEALSRLGAPVWPTPRPPTVESAATVADESFPSLGAIVVSRVVQLTGVFVVVTIVILAMSLVANAMR